LLGFVAEDSMRIAHISAVAAAVCLALAPIAAAGQKGKGGGAPKTTAHGPSTHAQPPRTQTTHGNPHTTTPKTSAPTTTHGNPHTTTPKTSTPTTTKGNPHTSSGTTTTKAHGNPRTTTSTSGATTTTRVQPTTDNTTTPNPIAQKLQGKPLGSRIEHMLPANMTLDTASAGFRNQGQFIAAVHVSQNLGIPFADLKATMLGTPLPGSTTAALSPMSLGQAIQQLKPFANATTEASRAETQATDDLRTTSTTSSSITTTKSKKRGK
jgi:hypothetical protein